MFPTEYHDTLASGEFLNVVHHCGHRADEGRSSGVRCQDIAVARIAIYGLTDSQERSLLVHTIIKGFS